jgi:hypothetical protein
MEVSVEAPPLVVDSSVVVCLVDWAGCCCVDVIASGIAHLFLEPYLK